MNMHPDLSAALTLLNSASKILMNNPEFKRGNSTHHFATHQVVNAAGHLVCLDVDIARLQHERQQLLAALGEALAEADGWHDDACGGPAMNAEMVALRALYEKLTNPQQGAAQTKEN